jgi:hypothetical protein
VKVSSEFGDAYRADLVRIIHGDANPDRSRMTAEHRSESQAAHDSGRGGFLGWLDMFCGSFRTTTTKTTSRGCWKTFCGGSLPSKLVL